LTHDLWPIGYVGKRSYVPQIHLSLPFTNFQ